LHEYASELAWREVEDRQTELDGVGDEQKEGEREGRGKEMKKGRRRGHTMTAIPVQFQEWGVFTVKYTMAKKRGHLKDKNGNPVGQAWHYTFLLKEVDHCRQDNDML